MLYPARSIRSWLGAALVAATFAVTLGACSGGAAFTPLPSGAAPPGDCATADADNVIVISAENLDFSAPCMVAPADTSFTIRFTNHDSIEHDVALYADSSRDTEYFRGEIITGPDRTIDYAVDPIPAGDHFFDCVVHPAMRGALYVR
jgi:plastocyanin